MSSSILKDVYYLIPAYEPSVVLCQLVEELLGHGVQSQHVIIVNDGSAESTQDIFEQLRGHGCQVLQHEQNQGKGAALKTGFRRVLEAQAALGVVTLDADGQHDIKDVLAVAKALEDNPDAMALGVRTFGADVPLRSKVGNICTKYIFAMIHGKRISDTQTGLRALNLAMLTDIIEIEENGYELETQMLIMAVRNKLPIVEVPIATIYIDHNASSHFNPLKDSLKIYIVLLRFALISMMSFVIDISLFVCVHYFIAALLPSLLFSRFFSSLFNFMMNKIFAFKARDWTRIKREYLSYLVLCMCFSYTSSHLIPWLQHHTELGVVLSKIAIDVSLFLLAFVIQRTFIFRQSS